MTVKQNGKVALYARISHDAEGEAKGVNRQLDDLRAYVQREGWDAVEYLDPDTSASRYSRKRRKAFDRMIVDVHKGRVSTILVYELSRYTREPRLVEDLIDLAEAGRVELIGLQGGAYGDTPEGRLRLRIEAASHANYSDQLSRKQKRKKAELQAEGWGMGGVRAFGYQGAKDVIDATSGKIKHVKAGTVLETREAQAYRKAVADVLAGVSLMAIAVRWNSAGFRTPRTASPWSAPSVKATLTNPRHAGCIARTVEVPRGDGTTKANGTPRTIQRYKIIEGMTAKWPAIITREQHDQIVELLFDPQRRRKNPPRRGILTGRVVCEKCGGTMRRDGRDYRCRAEPETTSCGKNTIRADDLDTWTVDRILFEVGSAKFFAKLDRAAKAKPRPKGVDDPAKLEAQLDQIAEAVAAGKFTIRQAEKMSAGILDRLAGAREHVGEVLNVAPLSPFRGAKDPARVWKAMDDDQRRAVVACLLDALVIAPPTPVRGFDPARIDPRWRN